MEYLYVLLIMLVAGLVQGSCGFGAGLVGMSLMPFFFDYKTALPIMFIGGAVISIRLLAATFRHVNWKLFLVPVSFSFLGRVAGLMAFNTCANSTLSIILGCLIILVAVFQLLFSQKISIRPRFANGALAGVLSGIFGGLASASGPPLVVYYMNARLEKTEYIATLQATFVAGSLFSISLLAASGAYTVHSLSYGAVAAVGVAAGSTIGLSLFRAMNREMLQKIINLVLLAMGVSIIVKAAS